MQSVQTIAETTLFGLEIALLLLHAQGLLWIALPYPQIATPTKTVYPWLKAQMLVTWYKKQENQMDSTIRIIDTKKRAFKGMHKLRFKGPNLDCSKIFLPQ